MREIVWKTVELHTFMPKNNKSVFWTQCLFLKYRPELNRLWFCIFNFHSNCENQTIVINWNDTTVMSLWILGVGVLCVKYLSSSILSELLLYIIELMILQSWSMIASGVTFGFPWQQSLLTRSLRMAALVMSWQS